MSKFTGAVLGALALVALTACEKNLVVQDLNQPDQARALASATDVENLVVSQFRNIHNTTDGTSVGLEFQLECNGMENASSLGNAESGKYCGLPRVPVDNTRANPSDGVKLAPYDNLYSAARAVALGLNAMYDPKFTFIPADPTEVNRDRAFGYFELAVALGDVALVYDSGAVVTPGDNLQGAYAPLVASDSLMTVALQFLDSAVAYSGQPWGGNTVNANWYAGTNAPSTLALNGAGMIQLARSYKARFRANVARDPAARAAVNWASVIADAQAGVTADFNVYMTQGSPGWSYRPAQMDLYSAWHQMWQFMLGMADTSGTYAQYLANPSLFSPFLVATPDRRFPAGTTRAAQNTSSGCFTGVHCIQPVATAPYPYFRNRLVALDTPIDPRMFSMYDFYRFQSFFDAVREGPIPMLTLAELNMLRAEGYIRTGNFAAAVTLVNLTRTAAGLPAIVAADNTTPVPGGTACVPRVPAATGLTPVCGNLMEAMKWEKRLQIAYTSWGGWWYDGRGWGDLPAGTIEEYPVPYEELDTRVLPLYNNTRQSGASTYGVGLH